MIINPLELIKQISTNQFNDMIGATHIVSPAFSFGSLQQPFDVNNPLPDDPRISSDSLDRRFMMGISKWGGAGELISE